MWREEPEGVVTPVVPQSLVDQHLVVHELVHGHQLDGGDAEPEKMVDDRRVRETGVGAPHVFGDVRMRGRHALDMGLVDDRLVVGAPGLAIHRPVEERVDHHGRHGVPQRIEAGQLRGGVGGLSRRDRLGLGVVGRRGLAGVLGVGDVRVLVGGAVGLGLGLGTGQRVGEQ